MPKLSLAKLERHLYSAADRLRQEGLDAATYKDYIFGLLFLKRCSDVFRHEWGAIVDRKVTAGLVREEAETQYGENPDYYDTFFVPDRAHWPYLQEKLNDAAEPFGRVLDKALAALSEANESLEHVLDHISFMRTQGNTTRAELSIGPLRRLLFPFPLRSEQEAIASVLDEHDQLISLHDRESDKLQELKSGVMSDLLTGRVRVPEDLVGGTP
jgi:type I restriction enzyme M protein